MSEESETQEKPVRMHLQDVLSRLKELEHQSRTSIEHLSEDWLLLEESLKQKEEAERVGELLNAQNKVQDLVAALMEDMQITINRMENEGE